jgi:hypothetical protein
MTWLIRPARASGGANAGGLQALRALGYLELDVLILLQAAEAGAVNRGVVHEDVRPVGTGDEALCGGQEDQVGGLRVRQLGQASGGVEQHLLQGGLHRDHARGSRE